jgi:hypothetical protein
MIAYIRQNPNVAFDIHQQLIQAPYPHHLNAPVDSSTPQTPKRILDSSDNEDAQASKQQHVLSNGKQKNNNQLNASSAQLTNTNLQQARSQVVGQQEHRLPFEQLKRAVASNLPCFLIEYEQTENSKIRPSDVAAASNIEEHFKQQGISITFSLVGHGEIN